MRVVLLSSIMIALLVGCKAKTTLDPEDAKYVRATLDLIRVRAEFGAAISQRMKASLGKDSSVIADDRKSSKAPAIPIDSAKMDSIRFNASLDSVYWRDGISRQQFIDWTTALADDPKRAAAFYGALNDSVSGK
jgi:hypothetical protein